MSKMAELAAQKEMEQMDARDLEELAMIQIEDRCDRVRKDKEEEEIPKCEYIQVVSRTGHFNFANPSEESVSTHIAILTPDGKKKMLCNIRTKYEIYDNNPHQLAAEIEYYLQSIFYSTDDENVRAIRKYLIDNEDDLFTGNLQQELIQLEKKRDEIDTRIAKINITLFGGKR
jgi:hypothetical protein